MQLEDTYMDLSPSLNLARIKNLAIGELMSQLDTDGVMLQENVDEIWESLKCVSTL